MTAFKWIFQDENEFVRDRLSQPDLKDSFNLNTTNNMLSLHDERQKFPSFEQIEHELKNFFLSSSRHPFFLVSHTKSTLNKLKVFLFI